MQLNAYDCDILKEASLIYFKLLKCVNLLTMGTQQKHYITSINCADLR